MNNRVKALPNDYLKTIFWKAPNPISITTHKEGIYIDVNEAFTKFFGVRRQDLIGKISIDFGHMTKEKRLKILNDIKEKGHTENLLFQFRTKNNDLQFVLLNTVPIKIKKQVVLLSVGTDISRIKLPKDAQQTDFLIKSLDSIEETGVILIGNDENKQPSLFYMNEIARKSLQTKSIPELLDELEKNETICISTKAGFYHVKTISTRRSSPLKIILVERFPDTKLIKGEMKKHGLTPRQQEIALLVATGYSNGKIAEKFNITEHTVKDHVKKIFQILDVHSRSELCPKMLNLL
jgi:PAS domain S-box-containing protein